MDNRQNEGDLEQTGSYQQQQKDPRVDRFLMYLAGVLAAAFLAWAGVVWNAGETVKQAQFKILLELTSLTGIVAGVDLVIKQHINQPWHDDAGDRLIAIREQMSSVNRRLNAIENKIEKQLLNE